MKVGVAKCLSDGLRGERDGSANKRGLELSKCMRTGPGGMEDVVAVVTVRVLARVCVGEESGEIEGVVEVEEAARPVVV